MKYVYTIKDIKADTCLPPYLANNDEQASTMLASIVLSQDEKIQLCTHPEDFVLIRVSKWDEERGNFVVDESRVCVGNAMEIALSELRRQKAMRAKIEEARKDGEAA